MLCHHYMCAHAKRHMHTNVKDMEKACHKAHTCMERVWKVEGEPATGWQAGSKPHAHLSHFILEASLLCVCVWQRGQLLWKAAGPHDTPAGCTVVACLAR